nr:MAG TPA: hypothetical protein [Caudoviricetes sp.]
MLQSYKKRSGNSDLLSGSKKEGRNPLFMLRL